MKKKLVAFAVTAAMVVASAVPALAWEVVDNTPAFDTTQNQIVLTNAQKDGIVDEVEQYLKRLMMQLLSKLSSTSTELRLLPISI